MTEVSNMLYDFMFNIKHTLIFSEIQGCIFDPGENTVNFTWIRNYTQKLFQGPTGPGSGISKLSGSSVFSF